MKMTQTLASLALSGLLLFASAGQALAADLLRLDRSTPVYQNSYDAMNGTNATGSYSAGSYYIYKTASNGAVNISRTEGSAGGWIKPQTTTSSPTSSGDYLVTSRVNFRTGPSTAYAIISKLLAGTKVTYLATAGNFIKIHYQGRVGYVSKNYVKPLANLEGDPYVVSRQVNFRTGPSTGYAIISKLTVGTKITRLATSGSFAKIYSGGRIGYVHVNYIRAINAGTSLTDQTTVSRTSSPTRPAGYKNIWLDIDSGTYMINKQFASFYKGLGTDFIKKLRGSQLVQKLGVSGSFTKINHQGTIGYVRTVNLRKANRLASPIRSVTGNGLVVYLDPGHGGANTGAVSYVTGSYLKEDTINLAVAKVVKADLEAKGYTVKMSRYRNDETVNIYDRPLEANQMEADIFVSLHCNWSGSAYTNGGIVFYTPNKILNPTAADRAAQIELARSVNSPMTGVLRKSSVINDLLEDGEPFVVTNLADMPSILVEMGYMSNYTDAKLLTSTSGRTAMGKAIARGIDNFMAKYK